MKKRLILKLVIAAFFMVIVSCEEVVEVDTKPVAAFKVNEDDIEEGNSAIFTDLSFDEDGSIASWNWDFGDGESSTEQSPVHLYSAIGEYEVFLTVTDDGGQSNANDFSKLISVIEPTVDSISPFLWTFDVPYFTQNSAVAVSDNGTVYFGNDAKSADPTRGDYNMFAVKDGNLVWGHLSDEVVRMTPSIASDGTVYMGDYNGAFFAFNPDGTQRWMGTYTRFKWASPAIGTDGTIYTGCGEHDTKFNAISPGDGSLVWDYTATEKVRSAPAIDSDGIIYFSDFKTMYALNDDGTEKWKTLYGQETACAIALDETSKTVYACDKMAHLFAFNMEDGSIKWNNSTAATSLTVEGGPAIASDGTIYLGGEDGKMIAYNPEDGSVKWEFEVEGKITAVPAIDNNGNLYFGDDGGVFHVLDPEGIIINQTELNGGITTSATIGNDGTVYVLSSNTDKTGTLYALRSNATGLAGDGWPMRSKNARHTGR